jgi:hypothetical protein
MKQLTFKLIAGACLYMGLVACTPKNPSHIFVITDYGAVGDSLTLNTAYIQKAIDVCALSGGGRLVFPPGKFLTGTLQLRSNIEYHFAAGCMLIGSPDINHYNKPEGDNNIMLIGYQGSPAEETLSVLLDGTRVENVAFTGKGIIDGNGDKFWDKDFNALPRPVPWISFRGAKNIVIRDVSFQNAPSHVLRFASSSHITIDGIRIQNHPRSPNTDGIDLVDSQNAIITNSFINTGDDAICIKTDTDGLVENVAVSNCIIQSDDAAIKFGTGSAGITRYCTFTNNVIRKSRYGISLFMLEGGVFEHNRFSDLIITGGSRHKHEYPVFIDIDKKRPTNDYGTIRYTVFQNISIVSGGKILVTGRPENPVQNLEFSNIQYYVKQEANFEKATKPRGNKNFPKLESSIDRSNVAAHLTLAHIAGLSMHNVQISYDSTSTRKDIDLVGVKNLLVSNCTGRDITKLR